MIESGLNDVFDQPRTIGFQIITKLRLEMMNYPLECTTLRLFAIMLRKALRQSLS